LSSSLSFSARRVGRAFAFSRRNTPSSAILPGSSSSVASPLT
jgi:hypothetical protein